MLQVFELRSDERLLVKGETMFCGNPQPHEAVDCVPQVPRSSACQALCPWLTMTGWENFGTPRLYVDKSGAIVDMSIINHPVSPTEALGAPKPASKCPDCGSTMGEWKGLPHCPYCASLDV